VLANRLDRCGELDDALVDRAEASGRDGLSDIGSGHGAEQPALLARLGDELDLRRLERGLERLRLLDGGVLTRGTSGLDLLDLLLAATAPRNREALGDEVVAGVPVLDLEHVTSNTEARNLVRQND